MGIWDSIKNAAIKAKCGLGVHSGTAKNVDGKPLCYFELHCQDCGKTVQSNRHTYPLEWAHAEFDNRSDHRCTRVQKCIHCNEEANKIIHSQYVHAGKNGRCEVVEKCERCGDIRRTGSESHHWYRQPSQGEESGVTVKCHDCGKTERRSHF